MFLYVYVGNKKEGKKKTEERGKYKERSEKINSKQVKRKKKRRNVNGDEKNLKGKMLQTQTPKPNHKNTLNLISREGHNQWCVGFSIRKTFNFPNLGPSSILKLSGS